MDGSIEVADRVADVQAVAPLPRRQLALSLASLMMAMALAALDNNIVNTALPRMAVSLGGLNHLSWVVTAFMLASTITMPLYGKLSDKHGRRPLFTVAITIFLIGSILCSLAMNMTQLILFRLVQGIGAGGLIPLVMTAIGDIVPPRERGKYQGLFTAVFGVCNLAGPVVGGLLTDSFGWRSIFYVNIPVGFLALWLLRANLPVSSRHPHSVDYVGAGLVALTAAPFLLALSNLGVAGASSSNHVVPALVMAAIAGVALYWREKRFAEPIIAVNLFSNAVYVRSVLSAALIGLGFYGTIVFVPLFLQQAKGLTPSASGLMIAPLILGNIAASVLGGQLVSRTGRFKPQLVVGMFGVAAGLLLLSYLVSRNAPLPLIGVALAFIGVNGGLSMPQLTISVQNAVQRHNLGAATSTLQFFNSLAGSSGVAVSGSMLNRGLSTVLAQRLGAAAAASVMINGVASSSEATRGVIVNAYCAAMSRACLLSGLICLAAFISSLFIPNEELGRHQAT